MTPVPIIPGTSWVLVTILVACQGQTEEDEKRPYKFAFAIEGYQHRSEEKDERGIIMGEFGFVTGDGVYHVTVYATDENGDFKILSMKNYYVGLPGEGTTVAPSRAPTPTPKPTTPRPASVPQTTRSPILQHLDGLKGCSSCVIPDKKKNQAGGVAGVPPSEYGEGLIDERFGENLGTPGTPGISGGTFGRPTSKKPFGTVGGTSNGPGGSGPVSGVSGSQRPGSTGSPQKGGSSQLKPASGGQFGQTPLTPGLQRPTTGVYGQSPPSGSDRFGQTPLRPEDSFPGNPQSQRPGGKPSSRPGQSSIPGSPIVSEGLPPGMSMEDLMVLLYKYNYTLKFHGHHESGYRNGDKEGGYFFNGRDGLGRNVKYLANEFGFQPNITLVELGLQSLDTPKGGEDELNNELKGYEFKWFYRR